MPAITKAGSPTNNGDSSYTIDSTGSDRVSISALGMSTTQGWWAARLKMLYASTVSQDLFVADWRDDASNYIRFGWHGAASGASWVSGRHAAGSGSDGAWVADTFAANDHLTVIMSWTATTWAQSIKGGAFSALANTNIPTLASTVIDIGQSAATAQIGSAVFWFAQGTGTLADADATTINGFGDTDKLPSDFPGTCIDVWQANTDSYLSTVLADPLRPPVFMSNAAIQRVANW